VGTIIIVAGLIYLLFFSKLLDVREVSFNGLDTINSDDFKSKIEEQLNRKIFKYLPRKDNIFFVDTSDLETQLASTYPVFKKVDIRKKLLHGLVFNFLERKPAGIWCFTSTSSAQVNNCQYFDEDKVLWGESAQSSGFIFLTIEDQREKSSRQVDDEFFKPIMEVARNMVGEVKKIVIPKNSFSEFRVYTADYYIIFSTEFDTKNQLDVLKILMSEKAKDSSLPDGFHPQYIDLRIDGRVYYK
jgi:hypothetical protein